MKILKNILLISGIVFAITFTASYLLSSDLLLLSELSLLNVFLLMLIGVLSIRKVSKEYFMENKTSFFREREDSKVVNKKIVFFSYMGASLVNLVIYFIVEAIMF